MNDLAVPGFFAWSNGHMVTFTYWDLGEPTNHDGFNEDCVKLSYQVREEQIYTLQCIQDEGKKTNLFTCLLYLCFRLADGTTSIVRNLIPLCAKCPKRTIHCPPCSPPCTDAPRLERHVTTQMRTFELTVGVY